MTLRNMARALALLSALSPVAAWSADWVVTKVSQPARYSADGKSWQPLAKGMTVPNESWISTGTRGRVVIERAKDRVTFQPGTTAGVFEKKGWSIHTDFAQQTGTLQLSIDPKVKPHLAVQTPYLAAVVKGTVFSVSVKGKGAAVSVDRGRVEVTDALSGERTGVRAGQTASVDDNPSTSMSLDGRNRNFEPVTHVSVPSVNAMPSPPSSKKSAASSNAASPGSSHSSNGSSGGRGSGGNSGGGSDSGGNGHSGSGNGNSGQGGGGNSGNGNSGNGNAGNSNSGGGNSGNGNSGNGNSGNGNTGNGNSGHGQNGHGHPGNSGHGNSGHGNSGHGNSGNGNSGNGNSGNGNSGSGNSGNGNSGDDHSGHHGHGNGGNGGGGKVRRDSSR